MNVAQIAGGIGALVAALGGIVWLIRGWWRVMHGMHQLIELIQGRPPRWPGDPEERPGLARHLVQVDAHLAEHAGHLARHAERLERGDAQFDVLNKALRKIDAELHPNGGSSLRDQVDGLRDQVVEVARATGAAMDADRAGTTEPGDSNTEGVEDGREHNL